MMMIIKNCNIYKCIIYRTEYSDEELMEEMSKQSAIKRWVLLRVLTASILN